MTPRTARSRGPDLRRSQVREQSGDPDAGAFGGFRLYPEIFFLTLFGILLCALFSEHSPLKGEITGCLGLLLASVGIEVVFGTERLTAGQPFLWNGIDRVTAIIAL